METVTVGNKKIGEGQPCFFIAEGGLNHQGQLHLAKSMVDIAVMAGADAVKFQKRTPQLMLTKEALARPYGGPHSFGKTYGEHRAALELSDEDYVELKRYCDEKDIIFLASVWDEKSADLLEKVGASVYKIGSPDMTNWPLLEHVAKKGKPIILSTGMATVEEIDGAVNHINKFNDQIILLHCVLTYPCKFEEINLRVMDELRKRFKHPVGYSGHELGIAVSLAAVALGACVVERHFTIDRTMKGGDHAASLELTGLKKLIRDIRAFESALGNGKKVLLESEKPSKLKLAKSLVAKKDIKKGIVITKEMLTTKSPGHGLAPKYYYEVPGKKAKRDIKEDTTIMREDIEW